MDKHISSVVKSCFHQLREFRHIRSFIQKSAAIIFANAFIHSCIDYCNSLFYGLPKYSINRLQKIQNSVARIVTRTSRSSHITPMCYMTVGYTTMCYMTVGYTTMCYMTVCYMTVEYTAMCYMTVGYTTMCYMTVCYMTVGYTAMCYMTVGYTTMCYMTVCYITMCYLTVCYIAMSYFCYVTVLLDKISFITLVCLLKITN